MSRKKVEELGFIPPDSAISEPDASTKTNGWTDGSDTIYGGNYNWLWRSVSFLRDFVSERFKTFYVDDVSGDDDNDGTPSSPFSTLQEALESCGGYGRVVINLMNTNDYVVESTVNLHGCTVIIQNPITAGGKVVFSTDTDGDRTINQIRLYNANLAILNRAIKIGDIATSGTWSTYTYGGTPGFPDYFETAGIAAVEGNCNFQLFYPSPFDSTFADTASGGGPCAICTAGRATNLNFYNYITGTASINTDGGDGGVVVGFNQNNAGIVNSYFRDDNERVDDVSRYDNIYPGGVVGGAVINQRFECLGLPDNILSGSGLDIYFDDILVDLAGDFSDADINAKLENKLRTDVSAPFHGAGVYPIVTVDTVRDGGGAEDPISFFALNIAWSDDRAGYDLPITPIKIDYAVSPNIYTLSLVEVTKPKPRGHNHRRYYNMG